MQTKNTFVLPITFEIQICVNPSQNTRLTLEFFWITKLLQTLEKLFPILDPADQDWAE